MGGMLKYIVSNWEFVFLSAVTLIRVGEYRVGGTRLTRCATLFEVWHIGTVLV